MGGPRRRLPSRRGPARRPVALDAQRGDDARPVEDRPPGRDRRRLRAHRLLPVQRSVHAPDLRRAADFLPRHVEQNGVPPARGLRLRGDAVQLHGDRRKPSRQRRADGEHGRLEACLNRRLFGALSDEALRGRRSAPRRDQPRLRLGRRDRRSRAREPPPCRRPLHRLDPCLPVDVEDDRQQHRELPQLPADRRRDGRKGFHRRAPLRRRRRQSRPRSSEEASSTRDRSVQPRRASSRRPTSGRRSGSVSSKRCARSRWATSPTSRTSWAR